jgi:hypothetical protein
MRTTLSIPDEYYGKIKPLLKEEGFSTVNDFLLDLLRHHFDVAPIKYTIKNTPTESLTFEPGAQIIKTPQDALKRVGVKKVTELPFSKQKQSENKL